MGGSDVLMGTAYVEAISSNPYYKSLGFVFLSFRNKSALTTFSHVGGKNLVKQGDLGSSTKMLSNS